MNPGPWYLVMRPGGGYAVRSVDRKLIAEFYGTHMAVGEHRRNATACAQVPDMVEVLRDAEAYFGDRPARDSAARVIHANLIDVMVKAGIETLADRDK